MSEIWNKQSWQPAFADLVKKYETLMHSTHLADEFQGAIHDLLLSGACGETRKGPGRESLAVYGAYVDDVMWDRCHDGIPAQNLLQPGVAFQSAELGLCTGCLCCMM